MTESAAILFKELPGQGGKLGLITLNRPQALNALNHEMVILLHQQLLQWETATDLKAVIIQAAPGRAFCAGGDLRAVYEKRQIAQSTLSQYFRDEYRLNHCIFHYKKPYIALLDGITMGGGAGISLHGSHRLGSENLVFAMPETGIGFFPDVGASYFLSRLSKGVGFYLGLTGARLKIDDCLSLGLLDFKIASEQIPDIIKALAETAFEGKAEETVSQILKPFQQTSRETMLPTYYPFIQKHFLKTSVEELITSLQQDENTWCQETATTLQSKAPTSLKVVLKQLHEGLKRDFDQCLQLEYHLMCHFIQAHDFFEGIRAVLIEKNQAPLWRPAQLSELSQEDVDAYFLPLAGAPAQLLFS